jgi:hypothetical protein
MRRLLLLVILTAQVHAADLGIFPADDGTPVFDLWMSDKALAKLGDTEGTTICSSERVHFYLTKSVEVKGAEKGDVTCYLRDATVDHRYRIHDGGFVVAVVYRKKPDAEFKAMLAEMDKALAMKPTKTIDKTLPNGGLIRIRVVETAGADAKAIDLVVKDAFAAVTK